MLLLDGCSFRGMYPLPEYLTLQTEVSDARFVA